MQLTRLKESEKYRELREQLRLAELELTDHVSGWPSSGASCRLRRWLRTMS